MNSNFLIVNKFQFGDFLFKRWNINQKKKVKTRDYYRK